MTGEERAPRRKQGAAATRGDDTRARIIAAAAEVFARDGVAQGSMAAILRAAGQRNEAAVAYHFGSREALAIAIVEERRQPLADLRMRMLAEVTKDGDLPSLRRGLEALVRPMALGLETHDGRNYLRIVADLFRTLSVADRLRPRASDVRQAIRLIEARLVHLPEDIVSERVAFGVSALIEAMALRATDLERHSDPNLDADMWVENLLLITEAMLLAPVPSRE